MNKTSHRFTKKQHEQKTRRLMASVYILIAVVAIIECLLLVTFTTFSWIESNSSLIIRNGPESSQVDDQSSKKMDITNQLAGTINLNYDANADFANLNNFFSEVKYFQFAKATSSDGQTLFFPCRNNTYSTAGKYRKGDTIDYNTSYLYFDFTINNSGDNATNRDVYFDEDAAYSSIFTVTGDTLTTGQKAALCNAMRMSITTQVGSASPNTKIYSKVAYTDSVSAEHHYQSFDVNSDTLARSYAYDETAGAGHTNDRNTWVKTYEIDKSVYASNNNVITSDKLFVVRKNASTKVSFRIWFDVFDPDFRTQFGLDSQSFDYSNTENAYSKIPDATVGIKFRLKTSGNDLRSIYFDDYTLSNLANVNNNIKHLTDENQNYSVWFYAYQPAVAANAASGTPARSAKYMALELEPDRTNANYTRWTTNYATDSMMSCLMNDTSSGGYGNAAGNGANEYTKAFFCYGDYSTKQAIYKWPLPAAPTSDDYTFNAYSYLPNSSTNTSGSWNESATAWQQPAYGTWKTGVGIWQNDAASTMTLLKFRDKATTVVSGAEHPYNSGSGNYHIMNATAAADNHSHYLVYANNVNSDTFANNFTSSVVNKTAAMYYDTSEEVFKSYVPTGWLSGGAGVRGVSFTYCPGGAFTDQGATLRWYNDTPEPLNGEYMFTALGYSNRYDKSNLGGIGYTANFYSGSSGFIKGIGTWRDIELIKFSTELIDNSVSADYRYFIGITDSYSQGYYAMVPNDTCTTFSAWIPSTQGSTTAGVNFARLNAAKESNNDTAPAVYWYGSARSNSFGGDYTTFYPVDCSLTSATQNYTHGYWNLSVLVDGTYENLIYDTLTDGTGSTYAPTVSADPEDADNDIVDFSPRDNYGTLEYSYDGSSWVEIADDTDDTLDNCIDRYRFYVNAENHQTVYWRWTPYTEYTSFTATRGGETVTFPAGGVTQFVYTHSVANASATGIYKVVTEEKNNAVLTNSNNNQGGE